jgi:hypothetical protein
MLSRKFPTSSENTAELVGQVKFSNLLIVHLQRTAGSEKLQRRSKLYPKGQLRAESRIVLQRNPWATVRVPCKSGT